MTQSEAINILKDFEIFKDLPIEQIEWYVKEATILHLEDGEYLFKPNEPLDFTHIMIAGEVKIRFSQNGQQRELYVLNSGDLTGNLPYSRATVGRAEGIVSKKATILSFPKTKFPEMIREHHELTTRFVHEMTTRVREFTQMQTQNEKMMALGKLSAGLAHELNNPAAAIVRSSTSLMQHLQLQPESFKRVIAIGMSNEQVDAVNNRLFAHLNNPNRASTKLSLMERAACEDELVDWLEEHNIDNAYEIAENFVEFGFTDDDFDFFVETIPEKDLSPVLGWINNNLITDKMVSDIQEASKRISDLVASVKNFTHMDKAADKQLSNIHDGIRNTMTMLNHKFKKNNIQLIEDFQKDLPEAKVYISELNQVWTNLIDNAIDALESTSNPTLTIHTRKDGDFLKVSLTDNGPGIPAEVKNKIFDPFFTTKEMGKGTGLGLDVVNRIVKQHNGKVTVISEPGRTEFEVCIPFN